ncbi:hypothetical protein [Streptomyces sp. LNU-CPARS28]|uniref:hypothetical protein n=1 Tax=Streptomyces sp. LNU-CPARS28 TaxID=3137371 RepID=UPI0031360DC2
MLAEGLPVDGGALARAVTGSSWTLADYRLADTVDLLARLDVAFRNVHRAENAPPVPWPDPVPRPGDPSPRQLARAREREAREAREGYEDIVRQVAPGRL